MATTQDLLDLHGVDQRATAYRFELLDRDDNVIGELHPQRDSDLTPTIVHDTTRAMKRDMTGLNLTPVDNAQIDPLSNRVRPLMLLEDGSEFPLGIFLFSEASNPLYSYGQALTGNLHDKGFILDQSIEHSVGFPAGTPIRNALRTLLDEVGVTSMIDAPLTLLGAPVAWAPGTSRFQVLADLCVLAGLVDPWFDHQGLCRIHPIPVPEMSDPVVHYIDGRNIYRDSIIETSDLLTAPNRIVVISSDSLDSQFVGVFDIPAGAPHSFFRRGFHVVEVFNAQGLGSQSQALQVARDYAANRTVFRRLIFNGPPDPRHDGWTVVTFQGVSWVETGWSLALAPSGPMTHNVRRVLQ